MAEYYLRGIGGEIREISKLHYYFLSFIEWSFKIGIVLLIITIIAQTLAIFNIYVPGFQGG